MPTYSVPGTYVTETPLSTLTPSSSGVSSAVFFGESARGPLAATRVDDWNSYKSLYGDIEDQYDLGYSVYHYFANGGRSAYIVRVLNASAVVAYADAVPFYPTGSGNSAVAAFDVDAIGPGEWGNDLTVTTLAGNVATTDTKFGTFTLVVNYGSSEVERWLDVTLDPNASRYVENIVNDGSRYVRISNVNPTNATPDATLEWSTTPVDLANGTQSAVADSDYTGALTRLDSISEGLLINMVGKTSSAVVSSTVAKAASRGDSFVIIDPDKTDTTLSEVQSTASPYAALSNGGYAAAYAPALVMVDPAKTGAGATRVSFPGGAVAGVFVRKEVERHIGVAPAGFSAEVRGALGLSIALTDAERGTLYEGSPQVNTFKTVAGAAVTIQGARTLNKTNPDKFISVRRVLNYVKSNLKTLTEFAVFEPNNEALWTQLNAKIAGFLTDLYQAGALSGDRPSEAFYVLCDSSNNTAASREQGVVNVEVGIVPPYTAEYISVSLSQWAGGSSTQES